MDLPRFLRLTGLSLAHLFLLFSTHAAPPAPKEIAEAAAWFETLDWPNLRDKPYIEITLGQHYENDQLVDGPKLRGFLLAEDEGGLTVFSDGTSADRGNGGWPLIRDRINKNRGDGFIVAGSVRYRVLDLPTAVAEVIANLHRPNDDFGRKCSPGTALFFLARFCHRAGRDDLASQLDLELGKLEPFKAKEGGSFRESLEFEIEHLLTWNAVVDFNDPQVTRPQLLDQFERIERHFPTGKYEELVAKFSKHLRGMIVEDEEHARKARPVETLSREEQVQEWIFRLRDQNGHQWGQPGFCDIFDDTGVDKPGDTPAHQLVKLGFVAVPALIKALDDSRPTRSMGYHRDFYFSHYILTVGDCAEAVLSRIARRNFWAPEVMTTTSSMAKDGETAAARTAAEAWWREFQAKGEKEMLREGVLAGDRDSVAQAERLAALDPAVALEAIKAGMLATESQRTRQDSGAQSEQPPIPGLPELPAIDAGVELPRPTKFRWVRTGLIEVAAKIREPAAEKFLEQEVTRNPSLDARVAAAAELFRRGQKKVVAAMIQDWQRWRPVSRLNFWEEDGVSLMTFLARCQEAEAMKALAGRFTALPAEVKIELLEIVVARKTLGSEPFPQDGPSSPEIETLAEDLGGLALGQLTIDRRDRFSTTNERVCEQAARMLAQRWPQKYQFTWSDTRIERNTQIREAENTWRKSRGLCPLRVPLLEAPADRPNTIAVVTWTGGEPIGSFPLVVGEEISTENIFAAAATLRKGLPQHCTAHSLSVERVADRPGIIVEIEWQAGEISKSENRWNMDLAVEVGGEVGWGSLGHELSEDDRKELLKALAAPLGKSVSISLSAYLPEK